MKKIEKNRKKWDNNFPKHIIILISLKGSMKHIAQIKGDKGSF